MKKRIAVVTDELVGVNRGGGIGTCANGLVRVLISCGYSVDIIITDIEYRDPETDFYGARIRSLASWLNGKKYSPIDHVTLAYGVYEMLYKEDYAVVHFNDWRGSGYYYVMSRAQRGIKSKIVSHLHGPSKWVRQYNLELADVDAAELDALERVQIENSDYVVSPSQYLIDWYKRQNIKLPDARVMHWVLPEWLDRDLTKQGDPLQTLSIAPQSIKELIFFGRHERRKGFDLFLQALKDNPVLADLDLTFVGRFDRIEREFTGSRTLRLLEKHNGAIRFINDLDHTGAFAFLRKRPNALVLMPSIIENSPCVVGECFTIGIPFMSTDVGGISELFAAGSEADGLFQADPKSISAKIASALVGGVPSVKSVLIPKRIVEEWRAFHARTVERRDAVAQPEMPLVSVCIVHHNRPGLLRRALTALTKQTYQNFEVILVDDGSRSDCLQELDLIEKEYIDLGMKVIRSKNNYLGAARNLAARNANGDYLIFHDDDNISEPKQIETFVRSILAGKYDVLTSQYFAFHDSEGPEKAKIMYFPMGVGGSFSFFRNRFGDANAIIRKSAFDRLGGFSELKGVGWEDWELFLRAYVGDCKMGLVPEPLFRYRISNDGMLASTSPAQNHARIIAAIEWGKPSVSSDLIEFAKRDAVSQHILDYTWTLLGRTKHAAMHREMMALDPNGDEARYKLMELAFALRRHADAIEIGLDLKNGYHHVSNILGGIGDRIRLESENTIEPIEAGAVTRQAIMVRGWIASAGKNQLIADNMEHQGTLYSISDWIPEFREDVNRHLDSADNLSRGFKAIATEETQVSEKVRGPFSLSRGVRSERAPSLRMKTPDSVGSVTLRLPDLGRSDTALTGCIDELVTGCVASFEMHQLNQERYRNRVTIQTDPDRRIFCWNKRKSKLIELKTDSMGYATSDVVSGNALELGREDIAGFKIFLPGDAPSIRINFYALKRS